jgi:hypothetical protein
LSFKRRMRLSPCCSRNRSRIARRIFWVEGASLENAVDAR